MTVFIGAQQIGDICFCDKSIKKIITIGAADFIYVGECPNCKTNNLLGMSLLKAEEHGFILINNKKIEQMALNHNTRFVLCKSCGWWGWPDKI